MFQKYQEATVNDGIIEKNSVTTGSQEKFPVTEKIETNFIEILKANLSNNGLSVEQAESDADCQLRYCSQRII